MMYLISALAMQNAPSSKRKDPCICSRTRVLEIVNYVLRIVSEDPVSVEKHSRQYVFGEWQWSPFNHTQINSLFPSKQSEEDRVNKCQRKLLRTKLSSLYPN